MWNFGDGNISDYTAATNPSHQYAAAGSYSVNLTVTGPGGSNSFTKTRYIIVSEPLTAITVTSPNGKETWQRGTSHTVSWDYSGNPGSTVKITLVKGTTEVGTIVASTSIGTDGKGSCSWPVYSSGSTGSDYKVNVQSINQPTVKDTSNNYFSLTPAGTSSPSIAVTSPNGGETWQRGTTRTVAWDYSGSPGSTVKIMLVKGTTEVGTIVASTSIGTSGKGSYSWPVYSSGSTGSDYKVSVQSINQPTVKDSSNNYFSLAPAGTTAPSPTPTPISTSTITVTSPNGGETWARGTLRTITWDYTGSPGSAVKIVLMKGSAEAGTIIESTSMGTGGKGAYSWAMSSTGSTGTDYRVSVRSISQPSARDTSNNYFSLTPAATSSLSITVTSPNGGERWKRGTTHTITWDYTGSPGSAVKIVLMKGSAEAGTIIESTSMGAGGKGSCSWPVYPSGSTGSDYKVSVRSISQPSVKDVSNNYFALTV
jgi:5-hydroxyisourate hydrolase-like protein (transthyretin family)